MLKRILASVFLSILFLLPQQVLAASEFSTAYDVLYDVDESGITNVTEKITLKNLTSEYYAHQFKLTIGSTEVTDIKASDPGGKLEVTPEQKDAATIINVKFNQQVAGLGKSLPWSLSFKTKDFAEKVGKIWEIRAPRISSNTNLESYNLTLSVPESFGQPSSITPSPKSQTVSNGRIFLTFDKSKLESSGISATFGSFQIFDFDLSYRLENRNLVPILTNIALPPDTAYQDVIYQRIEPKPLNVTVDNDGNYVAWYRLNRGQEINVKVFGSARLYTNSKAKNPVLGDTLRKKYTEPQKYWEKNNPQITNKLNEILGDNPPTDTEGRARLIYKYVVNFLRYDGSRLKTSNIDRMGAVTALANPDSAVCMEFTDLFIALARAAGIPARELNGYAYSENTILRPMSLSKDILHSWPEYWSEKKGWVMVDPTWENTTSGVDYFNKLDLNHFVFVVKGQSSEEPIPAGSYKYKGQNSHDVKVTLSENDFLGKPQIYVEIDAATPILSGFPGVIKVKITNTGNAVYPSNLLSVIAGQLSILNKDGQKTGLIPPFGNSEFQFDIRTKSLLDSYNDWIITAIGKEKFTRSVVVKPFVIFQPVPFMVTGFFILMILIYSTVLGGHIYRKKTRKISKEK